MSVQGGTLGRLGTVHVPIWPVAMLLAAAIAAAIALSTIGGSVGEVVPAGRPAIVTDAVNPGMWTLTDAEAYLDAQVTFPRGLEHAGAYPVPVTIPVGLENPSAYGISQVTEAGTFPVGLENPSAYGISQVTEATYPTGLENPGAYPAAESSTPKVGRHQPIVVNGTVCGQCR